MAKFDCAGCEKKHDDWAWRNTTYTFEEGDRSGWFCTKWQKPTPTAERIPDSIKADRIKYANDMVQPYRQGQPSREYIKLYPKQAKNTFTASERKKAKNVWGDIKGIDTRKPAE
jgi:hypothetical protein